MFSVVIADDEPLIIKGLLKLVDWEKMNARIVGTSRNGSMLIRQIDELLPDIVISDISMPDKSGIDVIQYVSERKLKSKIIFLSAYQEFDYAKQALKYGAVDYLLKPVTKEELEKTILKAERLLEEHISLEYLHEDKKSLQSVFKTVTGQYDFQNLYREFQEMGVPVKEAYYTGVCFFVTGTGEKKGSRSEMELLRFSVFKKLEEFVRANHYGFCLKRENGLCTMVFYQGRAEEDETVSRVKLVIDKTAGEYNVKLAAGIGKKIDDLSDLKFAYKTAVFVGNIYYFEQREVIVYDTIHKDYDKSFEDYNCAYQALVKAALANDACWIGYLRRCLELIGELHYGNRVSAENRCVSLLMEFIRTLGSYGLTEPEKMKEYEAFVSTIRGKATYQKACALILDYLPAFVRDHVFCGDGNENDTIRSIKIYINENYDQDISLKAMAGRFFMNTSYFSTFFKKKTGMNFKDYLAEVRMKKALEIMDAHGSISTQELAGMVGYKDSKSFAEKFKQYYGESPSNYRNR